MPGFFCVEQNSSKIPQIEIAWISYQYKSFPWYPLNIVRYDHLFSFAWFLLNEKKILLCNVICNLLHGL